MFGELLGLVLRAFLGVSLRFVEFAHGIEEQIGGGAQHGALRGGGAVDEFVNAFHRALAGGDDLGDGFIAEEHAAFGVNDFATLEENNSVGIHGVDVQRAGLAGLAEHLDYAGQIEMLEIAAQVGFGAGEHLRGLKTVLTADQKTAHVRGDVRRASGGDPRNRRSRRDRLRAALVRLPGAASADGDERNVRGVGIGAQNRSHFERAHFAQIRGAQNRGGRVPFEHGERVGGLRAGDDFEADLLQRFADTLGEIDVAIDEQDARKIGEGVHGRASA